MGKKLLVLILLVSVLVSCEKLPGNRKLVSYIDKLTSYWGGPTVAAAIGVPGYAKYTPYNVINLCFVLNYGFADAASVWANPFGFMDQMNNPFGDTKEKVHNAWLTAYHNAGIKIMVSAFGATQFPTSQGFDANSTCTNMAIFVRDNKLDGIDLDYEDNEAMNKGTGEQWLITCTKAIRQILPVGKYIVTHAPQAPYFVGKPKYPNGGYQTVNNEVGNLIDWYNVQFYNQGDTTYDTYELLFIDAEFGEWNKTAVKQINSYGVPMEKIILGKPVLRSDATNTGWVSAQNLHDWAEKAAKEIKWTAGLMDWQLPSDPDGSFVKTYLYGNSTISDEEIKQQQMAESYF